MSADADPRLKDQADRIYGLYERKARSFRTSLISVMSLVTIVLALIFYPYVSFRHEKRTLEGQSKALQSDVRLAEQDADEIDALYRSYESQKHDALQELQKLRDIAAGEEPKLFAFHLFRAACKETGTATRRCVFKKLVEAAHAEAGGPFEFRRISELRNDALTPLHDALSLLTNSFVAYLDSAGRVWRYDAAAISAPLGDNPRLDSHWTRVQSREGGLAENYDMYVRLYMDLIHTHRIRLNQIRQEKREAFDDLSDEERRVQGRHKRIEDKLKDIQGFQNIDTPFGTLPVGLNELILLFPVLAAAGFVMCASLFVETARLRQEFHGLTRLSDPDQSVLPDRRIALIAPLWVDPLQPISARAVPAVILALPAFVFAGAVLLLWMRGLLDRPFINDGRLGRFVYLALYVASAAAIFDAVRRIGFTLWRYRRDVADV